MSGTRTAPLATRAPVPRPGAARDLRAVAAVVAFWWATTGVILLTQRSPATRAVALAAATALAVLGAALVARAGRTLTARGAAASFFGGSLLWLWVATLLYGGWVVGVDPARLARSGLPLVVQALGATLYNDLLGLAALAGAAWLARGGANRTGVHALALFWGAHQAAKLNVFLGVRHPGAELLPPYLGHLARYFGPATNSPALVATVVALGALAGGLAVRARRAPEPWARQGAWLLAALAALAALEHVLLGVPDAPAPWAAFLRARGG